MRFELRTLYTGAERWTSYATYTGQSAESAAGAGALEVQLLEADLPRHVL